MTCDRMSAVLARDEYLAAENRIPSCADRPHGITEMYRTGIRDRYTGGG